MQRVGIGYDVHRFAPGRKLILGGIEIPSELGLEGHSDADVLAHAIADAILGSIGEGDIGQHFPNSDPAIKGISSMKILEKAASLLRAKNGLLINVDASLIAEKPKVMSYAPKMKITIAQALGVGPDQIGIKATTNERMGFIGRGEGIAAIAVASVNLSS